MTVALINALAAETDEIAFAGLLQEGGRVLLADPTAIVDVGALALDPQDDAKSRAASALLARALDEARMAAENGIPEGPSLIDALDAYMTEQDASQSFSPTLRLRLAQVYARAGLAPPSFAILSAEVGGSSGEMPDIDDLLEPILAEFGEEPLQAYSALSELFAGLPEDLGTLLVAMTVARPNAVAARLGLYWGLDPRPDLRLAAATALLTRAETGALAARDTMLLPALRKWLPADAARDAFDAVIQQQMRSAGTREDSSAVTVHRAAMSLPDGAGAQSLIAAVQQGSRRSVAMAMLKQGHGVKDAFVVPCSSATEQKRMLAGVLEQIETFDVTPDVIAVALAQGLAEGVSLGLLPAPGSVDLAGIFGPDALTPTVGDGAGILAALDVSAELAGLSAAQRTGLIQDSGSWMTRFGLADSWFEDRGDLRAAITRARTEKGQKTAVWKHLETRREWWARTFAVSAMTLQAAGDAEWLSFAAVAEALLAGTALKRVPVMADIVDQTLEVFDEYYGSPGPGQG